MRTKSHHTSTYSILILILLLVNVIILKLAFIKHQPLYPLLIITVPALIFSLYKNRCIKHNDGDHPKFPLSAGSSYKVIMRQDIKEQQASKS
ncbi:MAG: hypothetical protein EOO13_10495 [Chitinophagaceae bacterium]|nr:MAG: hypothetical protein EOO13_10495 [Chitinophagaceae bacterium]